MAPTKTIHVDLTKPERATLDRVVRARGARLAGEGVRDGGTVAAWLRAHLMADAAKLGDTVRKRRARDINPPHSTTLDRP